MLARSKQNGRRRSEHLFVSPDSINASDASQQPCISQSELITFDNQEIRNREDALIKAVIHVERAQGQRLYFNNAVKDLKENESFDVLVADYSQNLSLPYLGFEQPGRAYYYSPLNVFGFGIVCMRNQRLATYVCGEGTGRKGGDNVASLLMKYLKDTNEIAANLELPREQRQPRGKLTIDKLTIVYGQLPWPEQEQYGCLPWALFDRAALLQPC